MPDVLLIGDTLRLPELRHEVPVDIGDPFLYAEVGGRRTAIVWSEDGAIHEAVCSFFEERGHMTRSNRPRGNVQEEGFNHGLEP